MTPSTDGRWKVKEEKASRASSSHDTKAEAVDRAKELAKNQELGQVVIHKKDMTIQTEHTSTVRNLIHPRDKNMQSDGDGAEK